MVLYCLRYMIYNLKVNHLAVSHFYIYEKKKLAHNAHRRVFHNPTPTDKKKKKTLQDRWTGCSMVSSLLPTGHTKCQSNDLQFIQLFPSYT